MQRRTNIKGILGSALIRCQHAKALGCLEQYAWKCWHCILTACELSSVYIPTLKPMFCLQQFLKITTCSTEVWTCDRQLWQTEHHHQACKDIHWECENYADCYYHNYDTQVSQRAFMMLKGSANTHEQRSTVPIKSSRKFLQKASCLYPSSSRGFEREE